MTLVQGQRKALKEKMAKQQDLLLSPLILSSWPSCQLTISNHSVLRRAVGDLRQLEYQVLRNLLNNAESPKSHLLLLFSCVALTLTLAS